MAERRSWCRQGLDGRQPARNEEPSVAEPPYRPPSDGLIMGSTTELAIIVVNFRTPTLTLGCLRSLEPEVACNPGTRVVVVENGSGDESAVRLRREIEARQWSAWCTLVESDVNWGFAGGSNRGIERVQHEGGAERVLLLNSDTVVHPGCLARCQAVMRADRRVGAMSCRLLNADGTLQNVCRRFPTPARCIAAALSLPWRFPRAFGWADCEDPGWDRTTSARDVDWLGGAFLMLRGDWIARHGALDERFFFYGEDIELCYRIRRTGLRCYYDPVATVTHLGGASSDPSRMTSDTRTVHRWRGRYLVQRVCYGGVAETIVRCTDIVTSAARVGWGWLVGRKSAEQRSLAEVVRFLLRNWSG